MYLSTMFLYIILKQQFFCISRLLLMVINVHFGCINYSCHVYEFTRFYQIIYVDQKSMDLRNQHSFECNTNNRAHSCKERKDDHISLISKINNAIIYTN